MISFKNSKLPILIATSSNTFYQDNKKVNDVLMPDKIVGMSNNYWGYVIFK